MANRIGKRRPDRASSIRTPTDTSSTGGRLSNLGAEESLAASTSPTVSNGSVDDTLPLPPALPAPPTAPRAITLDDLKSAWVVAGAVAGLVFFGATMLYHYAKFDSKVEHLNERQGRIEGKLDKLLEDGAQNRVRIDVIEGRVGRVESRVEASPARAPAKP